MLYNQKRRGQFKFYRQRILPDNELLTAVLEESFQESVEQVFDPVFLATGGMVFVRRMRIVFATGGTVVLTIIAVRIVIGIAGSVRAGCSTGQPLFHLTG